MKLDLLKPDFNPDLIRIRFDNDCRSWIYQERDVTTVDYIEGYLFGQFKFGLLIQDLDETSGQLFARAAYKMVDTIASHMMEELGKLSCAGYTPPTGMLVLSNVGVYARKQKARIAQAARKFPGYINNLKYVARNWITDKDLILRRTVLSELSWYYYPDPEFPDTGDRTEYNRVMRQLEELDFARR